ncbi:organic cation transporter 1-like [Nymphalis io]|uniref:organic cation transporter 1-like n=1 Tax=Inachis io TaxID=171585 RepID=UPI002169A140|nr:organic cation transporter 1-like [Nymphalis io]
MSEVNLQGLGEQSNDGLNTTTKRTMQEYDTALKACGFGLFHIRLLCTSFVGMASGIVITNTAPYILPIAECDLNMNLLQKGLLNAMPYSGMIVISVIAGFLTDTFGRKIFLVLGYGGLFLCTFTSGLSQSYLVLVIAKFCEGILFAISFTSLLALTSELCHNGIRDRIMLLQSSFAAIAQIIVALVSWAILPNNWKSTSFFNGMIVLNTWNYYLLIMSLFPISACIMYSFLPESPKYCITQKRYDEARETLIKIYKQNIRKPVDDYPFVNMWKDKNKLSIDETPEHESPKSFCHMLSVGFHNVKPMFHRPLGLYVLLFCTMNFFIMNLFNVIRLWFPQVSTIVEHYADENNQDLCVMLDAYTHDLRMKSFNATPHDICVPKISGTETYINSIIMGSICIVPYVIGGVLVNKVGKKNLFIVCGILCVATTIGLRWANSKIAIVALFSTITALGQIELSLNQFMVIDQFPTTTRSLAIGLVMTIGRTGSLVGNVIFPVLLNIGCVVPFFTMAGTMTIVTLMSFVIPTKKK